MIGVPVQPRTLQEYREAAKSFVDFARYTRLIRTLLHSHVGFVAIIDDEKQFVLAESNAFDEKVIPEVMSSSMSVCQYTVREDDSAFVIEDLSKDERFDQLGCVTGRHQLRSYAGFPIKTDTGYNVGSVCALDKSKTWQPHETLILGELSRMISNDFSQYFQAKDLLMQQRMQGSIVSFIRSNLSQYRSEEDFSEDQSDDICVSETAVFQNAVVVLKRTLEVDGVLICSVADLLRDTTPACNQMTATMLGHCQRFDRPGVQLDLITRQSSVDVISSSGIICHDRAAIPKSFLQALGTTSQAIIAVPLHDTDNVAYGLIFVYSDSPHRTFTIAQKEYLEAFESTLMLETQRAKLTEAEVLKDQFIASLSHELRTPLHGLLHNLDLLKETPLNEEQAELLSEATLCGNLQLNVVESVLNFSVVQGNKSNSDASNHEMIGSEEAVDIMVVVENAVALAIKRHHRGSGVISTQEKPVVIVDAPQSDHVFRRYTDPGCLRGLVEQLVLNALKWTSRGHIKISVRMSSSSADDRVYLSVYDTGAGIGSDFLKTDLYRRFTKEDSFSQGLGLGLSLVAESVKKLNGSISIESAKGSHTTVHVQLRMRFCPGLRAVDRPYSAMIRNKTIGILIPVIDKLADGMLLTIMERDLIDKHGLKTRRILPTDSFHGIDVLLGTESALGETPPTPLPSVMWGGGSRERSARHIHLASFYGPRNMASVLQALSESWVSEGQVKQHMSRKREISIGSYTATINPHPYKLSTQQSPGHKSDVKADYLHDSSSGFPNSDSIIRTIAPQRAALLDKSGLGQTVPQSKALPIPRVLIVEDNEINTRLLKRFMSKRCYDYTAAKNGKEAVDAVQDILAPDQGPYNVILMDLQMPVMDGLEATRQIRAVEKEHALKKAYIVACTGLSAPIDRKKAAQVGCDNFLTKPISLTTLRQLFNDWAILEAQQRNTASDHQ